jgi:glutathione S-transferase
MAPKLYQTPASGNCYKVLLLASLLDIDLEVIDLDFFNLQHKSPWYLDINPKGELPTLVDDGLTLIDSSGILVYLAGKSSSTFWSTQVAEQAQIIDWLAFTASHIDRGLSRARAILAFKWPRDAGKDAVIEAQKRAVASLKVLEERLESDNWLALGRPTIADISVFVYVALSWMGEVSLEPYPAIRAWVDRIKGLPGFVSMAALEQKLAQE